ncbi:hypothetical protein GCM10022223_52120 [Kineosporia mesophila]|uniref:Uncharacterized protein n=1 Tax=Kineosporia mesophila TaxID=566012 RepID=A0ABP7AAK1_9ACTN
MPVRDSCVVIDGPFLVRIAVRMLQLTGFHTVANRRRPSAGRRSGGLTSRAFVVVGHDERFLTEIGVDRRLTLTTGRLTETRPPQGDRP